MRTQTHSEMVRENEGWMVSENEGWMARENEGWMASGGARVLRVGVSMNPAPPPKVGKVSADMTIFEFNVLFV